MSLAISALYSALTSHLHLLAWREAYRFGELVGITATPGQGGSLGGQILRFTYSRPPAWYAFAAQALAASVWLGVFVLAVIALRSRFMRAARVWSPWGLRVGRWALVVMVTGIVYAALDRFLSTSLLEWSIALGEWLGGTVIRVGVFGVTQRGVFNGASWADNVGNGLVDYGPRVVMGVLAASFALVADTAWRAAIARRVRGMRVCERCGYDLKGTAGGRCPECGDVKAEPAR